MTTRLLAVTILCCVSAIQAQEPVHFTVNLTNPEGSLMGTGTLALAGNTLSYRMFLPPLDGLSAIVTYPVGLDPHRPPRMSVLAEPVCTNELFCVVEGDLFVSDGQIQILVEGRRRVVAGVGSLRGVWMPLVSGRVIPVDGDDDAVPDYRDSCPNTPAGAVVNANGCSIEQLCPCEGPWENHGQYLKQLRGVTADFLSDGLITAPEHRAMIAEGANSNCGKR